MHCRRSLILHPRFIEYHCAIRWRCVCSIIMKIRIRRCMTCLHRRHTACELAVQRFCTATGYFKSDRLYFRRQNILFILGLCTRVFNSTQLPFHLIQLWKYAGLRSIRLFFTACLPSAWGRWTSSSRVWAISVKVSNPTAWASSTDRDFRLVHIRTYGSNKYSLGMLQLWHKRILSMAGTSGKAI